MKIPPGLAEAVGWGPLVPVLDGEELLEEPLCINNFPRVPATMMRRIAGTAKTRRKKVRRWSPHIRALYKGGGNPGRVLAAEYVGRMSGGEGLAGRR